MTDTTFLQVMNLVAHEPDITGLEVDERLVYKFSAATIGNSSLTTLDPNIVKLGASYHADRFNGIGLYLETAAEERVATTMSVSGSTATINFIGGGNATNQAGATNVWLIRPGRWSEIKTAVNTALEYIPVECAVPLRHGPDDADMQANNTTSWTGTNCTVAKQTTAAEVLWGQRSLSLTLTSAGGYATSTTMRLGQNEPAIGFALAKADTGTGIFRLLDNSGNTEQSVSFTQEDWVYIRKQKDPSTSDEGAAIRLLGTDNNDQIDVQAAWLVKPHVNLFRAPSYADEPFKIKGIEVHCFQQGGYETDTWLAESVDRVSLIEGQDYRVIVRQADANPYWIEILPPAYEYLQYPMFLTVACPYSAPYGVTATYSADSDTNRCPPHLLIAAVKAWLGGMYESFLKDARERGEIEFRKRSQKRFSAKAPLNEWRGPIGGRRI